MLSSPNLDEDCLRRPESFLAVSARALKSGHPDSTICRGQALEYENLYFATPSDSEVRCQL